MDVKHKQIIYSPGFKEDFFYIDSDEIDANIEFIQAHKYENIGINKFKGYNLDNIQKVLSLKHVKKFSVAHSEINLDGLSELENLEYLVINAEKSDANFSNLKKLKYLSFFYDRKMAGLDKLANLESINVSKADESFLTADIFCNYKKLTRLEIVQSKLPETLDFLKCITKLKELEFHYIKSKIDLLDLLEIKESLEMLKIGHSKNVESIETLSKLKKLKWLALVDSVPLPNSKFINELPALEVLVVLGSSYFVDGNIDNLRGKLKHVGIDDKRHYTPRTKDFKNENAK
jgi:hypothetical protein